MDATKRDEYLRGIAASAPEVQVDWQRARQAILTTAFEQICNQENWRAPINAVVTVHEYDPIALSVYVEAVKYHTGTEPNTYVVDGFNAETRIAKYRIVSEGYRLGPAGA